MEDHGEEAKKWLYDMSNGLSHELEAQTLGGIQIQHSQNGLVTCKFLIPHHLVDEDGYWQVGAIAVLIDDVGAAAILSVVGHIKVSVDFHISYLSSAKAQEEVEIEAKVTGHKGKLTLVEVRIKKRKNGEIVAIAKQWMSSVAGLVTTNDIQTSKL